MTRIEIARGGGYHLVSIGNGWAYELSEDGGQSVFVQDDDATQMRAEWDAMPETLHTTACLARLMEMYS